MNRRAYTCVIAGTLCHLEVEVIVQAQHAVLISGIIVVDVAQQLDLV